MSPQATVRILGDLAVAFFAVCLIIAILCLLDKTAEVIWRHRGRRRAREQGQLIPPPRTPPHGRHASGPQPALRDLLAEDPGTDLEEYLYRKDRR